jgi:hypothetical protein
MRLSDKEKRDAQEWIMAKHFQHKSMREFFLTRAGNQCSLCHTGLLSIYSGHFEQDP